VKSFTQERDFVWSKPSSFTKYTFLLNRYLVPVCFFVLFISFSGFKGLNFSDSVSIRYLVVSMQLNTQFQACHWIISIITAMHPCSLALGNILMIARVVNLWDHNQVGILLIMLNMIVSSQFPEPDNTQGLERGIRVGICRNNGTGDSGAPSNQE
jgi:hypothetical protein